jgi:hypothetical protein
MEAIFEEIVRDQPKNYVALYRDLNAVQVQPKNFQDTLNNLSILNDKQMASLARAGTAFLESIDGAFLSLDDHWNNFKDGVINGVASVIDMIGINKLLAPSKGVLEPALKRNALLSLVTLLVTISGILVAAAVSNAPLIVLAVAIGLVVLTILHTQFKPASRTIPGGENLTQLQRQGKLPQVSGRSLEEQEVINAIAVGHNVMVRGKSGSGKTELIKGVVAALQKDPVLKHKMVIYFNTAKLAAGNPSIFNTEHVLDAICEAMGDHFREYIFVFDEIHAAFSANDKSFPEQMKTKINDENAPFPLVIGITTRQEYDKYINPPEHPQTAFIRRFRKTVDLENPSDQNTASILKNRLNAKAPSVTLEKGALNYIIEQTKKRLSPDAVQPGSSLFVLEKCLAHTKLKYFTEQAKNAANLSNRVTSLDAEIQSDLTDNSLDAEGDAVRELEESVGKLGKEETTKANLIAMQQTVLKIRKDLFKTAREAHQQPPGVKRNALFQRVTVIRSCIPLLEQYICEQAEAAGVKAVINKKLIDQVITDNLSDLKKVFAPQIGDDAENGP